MRIVPSSTYRAVLWAKRRELVRKARVLEFLPVGLIPPISWLSPESRQGWLRLSGNPPQGEWKGRFLNAQPHLIIFALCPVGSFPRNPRHLCEYRRAFKDRLERFTASHLDIDSHYRPGFGISSFFSRSSIKHREPNRAASSLRSFRGHGLVSDRCQPVSASERR